MTKIAIDIALLLPKKINKVCIDINRKNGAEAFSDLSKIDNHPHITLAMGVVDEKDLQIVETKLREILEKFSSLKLEITNIDFEITPENKKSYSFIIKPTDELKKLHAMIMQELLPIFSYNVKNEMFFIDKDEDFKEVSKYWVENYGKNHFNPDNYCPHTSLKCRKAEYTNFPIKFSTSKIAVCQLGNYCTCRKVFALLKI